MDIKLEYEKRFIAYYKAEIQPLEDKLEHSERLKKKYYDQNKRLKKMLEDLEEEYKTISGKLAVYEGSDDTAIRLYEKAIAQLREENRIERERNQKLLQRVKDLRKLLEAKG